MHVSGRTLNEQRKTRAPFVAQALERLRSRSRASWCCATHLEGAARCNGLSQIDGEIRRHTIRGRDGRHDGGCCKLIPRPSFECLLTGQQDLTLTSPQPFGLYFRLFGVRLWNEDWRCSCHVNCGFTGSSAVLFWYDLLQHDTIWHNMTQYDSQLFVLFFYPSDNSAQKRTLHVLVEIRRNRIVLFLPRVRRNLFYTPSLHELHHIYINMIDDDKKMKLYSRAGYSQEPYNSIDNSTSIGFDADQCASILDCLIDSIIRIYDKNTRIINYRPFWFLLNDDNVGIVCVGFE